MMNLIKKLKRSLSTTKDTTSQAQNTNQSDSPTGCAYSSTTTPSYQILKNPEFVGRYEITFNFHVYLQAKPFWLHRYMSRILLGWKWEDTK